MDRQLSPEDIEDLLAAYAVDAVDDDEREAIDEYLARTPSARNEVAELQTAASFLAHAGGPPPDGVWERLEPIITASRPAHVALPRGVLEFPRPAVPARPRRVWQAVAAVAAALALIFAGLWVAERGDGSSSSNDVAALALAADGAPGARHASLRDTTDRVLATAVIRRDGTGYLTAKLPPLASDRTYQLWAVTDGTTVSLGVLGPRPSVVAFQAAGHPVRLAITDEVEGGVVSSSHAPEALGTLVAA